MKNSVLRVHPKDNVLVALKNLSKGETIGFNGHEIYITGNISCQA